MRKRLSKNSELTLHTARETSSYMENRHDKILMEKLRKETESTELNLGKSKDKHGKNE